MQDLDKEKRRALKRRIRKSFFGYEYSPTAKIDLLVRLELGVVALSDVLGFLDGAIVLEANVVAMVLLGDQDVMTIMLLNNELVPFSALSGVQVTALVDAKVAARVGNVLELDVLGLVSGVQSVNLLGGGLAVASVSGDVVSVELQVLAGGPH